MGTEMLAHLLTVDGGLFVVVSLIVLSFPSPQPNLVRPVDEAVALTPFKETRRLLASQFFGAGVLALIFGLLVRDPFALRAAACGRICTLLIVVAVNVAQLRAGFWKPASLYSLMSLFALVIAGYVLLVTSTHA